MKELSKWLEGAIFAVATMALGNWGVHWIFPTWVGWYSALAGWILGMVVGVFTGFVYILLGCILIRWNSDNNPKFLINIQEWVDNLNQSLRDFCDYAGTCCFWGSILALFIWELKVVGGVVFSLEMMVSFAMASGAVKGYLEWKRDYFLGTGEKEKEGVEPHARH